MDYKEFIEGKSQGNTDAGFEPSFMPDFLFDFQKSLVEWAVRKGRAAIFADCGLGKTPMQLVFAENVSRHTDKPVLILTPLAVSFQTEREAEKFGIDAKVSRDGGVHHITITNYEKLHMFNPQDFGGCICDESSILKSFSGQTRKQVTRFMAKIPYRLLCTATAAPNDYTELGNSSEALGGLTYSEMLTRFFCYLDDKGQARDTKLQNKAEDFMNADPNNNYYKKLSFRVAQTIGQWRLKHHAITPFWRWVSSWARACRMPSDLGFSDRDFILPELHTHDHIINAGPMPGMLFAVPAFGLAEERAERIVSLNERCECVSRLVDHFDPAVIWCHTNKEADHLSSVISDAEQIAGATPDDRKVELYEAFAGGSLRVLVIKPKIGAWGLNWQHCNHVVSFASHSYEQYYQSIRRCWRFGQTRPVTVDLVMTDGEVRVINNLRRKAEKADRMFTALVHEMNNSTIIDRVDSHIKKMEVPSWLSSSK